MIQALGLSTMVPPASSSKDEDEDTNFTTRIGAVFMKCCDKIAGVKCHSQCYILEICS